MMRPNAEALFDVQKSLPTERKSQRGSVLRVAEIYSSVQGEGELTGTESVFLRASGCNLRCWFCDTPFASWNPEGDDLSVDEIVKQLLDADIQHVVITGGEPMLFSELLPICKQLKQHDRHITIETAGTLFLPVQCDLMSISPKLSNSAPDFGLHPKWHQRHESTRSSQAIVQELMRHYDFQLKFVVDTLDDVAEIQQYLKSLTDAPAAEVWLMPQGTDQQSLDVRAEWLQSKCEELGFRYCPRRQIEWFGMVRGT